jgi:hypothetical protein
MRSPRRAPGQSKGAWHKRLYIMQREDGRFGKRPSLIAAKPA